VCVCVCVCAGVVPRSGWAIDPFGLSPTMTYLLRRSGLDFMVVQRGHYHLKKHLSRKKELEFRWVQEWDRGHDSSVLCHLMPFYIYDVPHTCGPDPKVETSVQIPMAKYHAKYESICTTGVHVRVSVLLAYM